MKDIVFDTGIVTYSVNGKCDVTFNPTDPIFVKRLYSVIEQLEKKQAEYESLFESNPEPKALFDASEEMNREMRELVDGIFDTPVCDKLFGNVSIYSLANGLPLWANLLFAIMDEIDMAIGKEEKATNPRIEKYTAKYAKYKRK